MQISLKNYGAVRYDKGCWPISIENMKKENYVAIELFRINSIINNNYILILISNHDKKRILDQYYEY